MTQKCCICVPKDIGITLIGIVELLLALFYFAKTTLFLPTYWIFHMIFFVIFTV